MTDSSTVPLRFAWPILHVAAVPAPAAFYERTFGLPRRFIDPQGTYAELETGSTVLAFAEHELVRRIGAHADTLAEAAAPQGFEIALAADAASIERAYARAVEAGCTPVKPLAAMPWGQTVGFLRDPNGVLVEICTPAENG